MQSSVPIRENFPASVETQLLQDMHMVVGRISHLAMATEEVVDPDKALVDLLELALTMESTFAVWCWCHVHLERSSPAAQVCLKSRAEAALEDADRIAERLYQITGTPFQLEWLPAVNGPLSADGWTLDRSIRDSIAMAADRIALEFYAKLIDYARRHKIAAGSIFEEIAWTRKKRLGISSRSVS